ncbi:hypothetical protein [Gimibacter soli]|uniref:Solute-binding protein family 3/N-terminal domain-containing protein n=1 Tax=Gimibacter soli TaxID=3024400 RepID=A0AAF0BM80_9PROT|nr:hypothetical protein [Gimibacter soli]WCL55172.1 hypothetical protein PH603_05290 [Gimibacter soli]
MFGVLRRLFIVLVFASPVVAADPAILRVFTHGEGVYGMVQRDGTIKGPGVDQLACASEKLGIPYALEATSMSRSDRLQQQGLLDIWFPTYDTGEPRLDGRVVGHLGDMAIYWYLRKDSALLPDDPEFWAKARISAFPGSYPDRYIRRRSNMVVNGSDDPDTMVINLMAGRFDAFLAADIRPVLSVGIERRAAGRVGLILHSKLPMRFEVSPEFAAAHPGFMPRLKAAFDACVDQSRVQ